MKHLFYLLLIATLQFLPLHADAGKCTGSKNCTACTNCSRCKHCGAGGTCGVCAPARSNNSSSSYYGSSSRHSKTKAAKSSISAGSVHVKGYTRKDGTYVAPHTRKAPKRK